MTKLCDITMWPISAQSIAFCFGQSQENKGKKRVGEGWFHWLEYMPLLTETWQHCAIRL